MLNRIALSRGSVDTGENTFVGNWVNLMMLFFPLTSFLVIPTIPGTTVINVMALLLLFVIPLASLKENKFEFFKEVSIFFAVILAMSFLSQFTNLVTNLKLIKSLIMINRNDYTKTFYRQSHITQTLPLIVGFVIYAYVKYFPNKTLLNYIFWGLRILCFYALYEFLFYVATGQNGDFVTNRTFGESEKSASLFQTVSLGGMGLMRVKGYTGEPSMFVFTVFPFWVLSYALDRKFDTMLFLICLVLTFSTTSYACMLIFFSFWVIYKRQIHIFYYMCLGIIVVCFILQLDKMQHLFDSIYEFVFAGKLQGESSSSKERSNGFTTHLAFWADLNGVSQAVGIGFGYVRSTDFFSTIILNNGFIGFFVFSWFVLKNLWLKIPVRIVSICYKMGLGLVYLIMMATVPEFAYPSLWIYIALGFILQKYTTGESESETANTETKLALTR
ncbi:hypothetical protein IM792_15555 [Mucilaginibacter sp. JRF]|uniref:hypothetical protein n=1 Tax=Mucilaginibacter sp. JRF TaxID=2780088 RepID=UPI001880E8DE|nr:hypothetical protein [Mucilaginibacter sp. JRF]MBE9585872.1 hypothetical protein [Mucilaginibacter sp. JRF]